MARHPPAFDDHPIGYSAAKLAGLTRAICQHVSDGDTADFLLDLGWFHYAYVVLRIRGIDTPELVGTSGANLDTARAAKAKTIDLVLNKPALVRSFKHKTSFGRFIADIYISSPGAETDPIRSLIIDGSCWTSLADHLIANDLAKAVA